jgi:signal transduction histidine kinase
LADLPAKLREERQEVPADTAVAIAQVFLDVNSRRLYYLNDVARQLRAEGLPFTPEDLVQRPLHTLEGEPIERSQLPLLVALREEHAVEATFLWQRKHRPPRGVSWSAAPVMDAAGNLLGVVGSVSCGRPEPDWQGLAGLTHDLRMPLSVLGQASTVLKEALPADASLRASLEDIQAAAERAIGVARDLLLWCRAPLQRGRQLESAWFPLEPFLENLAREQTYAAQRKGLTLIADLKAAAGWDVCTDRVRLGRLLANLITCAIHFTGAGALAFTASYRNEPTGKLLVLGVLDTGMGISPEEQESIFHTFNPPTFGREEDSADSGLGLAAVDRLAKELEMEIEVFSEYGRGSAFRLVLPWRLLRPAAGARPHRLQATESEPERNAS